MPDQATPLDDQAQTRLAMAALFVALVRSLGVQDKAVPLKVEAELERLFYKLKNCPFDAEGAMNTLRWVNELLRD